MPETRCINFDECGNTHPTGMYMRKDGWGLQGSLKDKYKAICPSCLGNEHRKRARGAEAAVFRDDE